MSCGFILGKRASVSAPVRVWVCHGVKYNASGEILQQVK
jgi:hypothetical protein